MSHPPSALALVVCDQILNEPGTGKFTLVGLFSTILAGAFPCVHPRMAIYLALTDGYGASRVRLRLIDGATEAVEIWSGQLDLNFTDPRAVNETYLMSGPLTFPQAGEYRLRVEGPSGIIMERRIQVGLAPTKPA